MAELYHRQVLKASHVSSSTYNILVKTTYDHGKPKNMKWYSPLIGCILRYQIYKLRLDLLFFNKLQHTTEWLVFVCCQKC